MNESFRFALVSWITLISAIVILTAFVAFLVDLIPRAWDLFLDHRREKEILNRLRERSKETRRDLSP